MCNDYCKHSDYGGIPTMTIEELRKEIDAVDTELVSLLNRRYAACLEIGKLKQSSGTVVLDSSREQKIISRLGELSNYPDMIETLWPEIMTFSRKLQNDLNK